MYMFKVGYLILTYISKNISKYLKTRIFRVVYYLHSCGLFWILWKSQDLDTFSENQGPSEYQ